MTITTIAIRILEDRRRAPVFLPRRTDEFDAARDELLVRLLDVVAVERHRRKAADAILVLLRREEHDVRVAPLDAELDPALVLVERLIRVDDETHLLRPKRERASPDRPSE